MLGREINLPLDVMVGQPPSATSEQCYVQYVEWVKKATQRSYAVAHEYSKKAALRQKRNYDKRVSLNQMQEDDWVWYFYPPKAKQKLGQGWTGPYLVTHKVSDVLYQIQASSSSRLKIVHVDNLHPMRQRSCPPIGDIFYLQIKQIVMIRLTRMNAKVVMVIAIPMGPNGPVKI